MTSQPIATAIEAARQDTIQSRIDQPVTGGNVFVVNWIAKSGATVSPWWSQTRDMQLRDFWKSSDHIAGTVYTLQAKLTAIPFRIEARDRSVQEHVRQAEDLTEVMFAAAEFGEGWPSFYGRWCEDLVTQDNGAFGEIIGPGDPAGPLTGMPISIAHLDSLRCTRTGNAEYPVIYEDLSGTRYKMHYTRVLYSSQMPSPIADMFGVGFCSVSRCINVAQTLVDMLTFKQEKMGSRPHRKILVTKGGLDPKDLQRAFTLAETEMDNQGLTRYSKIVTVGSGTLMESGIDEIDLSTLPDGFDENTSTILGMATIALAFGMDARELFPALGAGSTRAEALLQHLKQRGKGPGQIIQITENLFNHKYLPPHLRMVFDFQDDAQDRQVADSRKVRAEKRQIDSQTGALDKRAMREQMLADGDIDRGQFERLELRDGRLADGSSILSLFYSDDRQISKMLDLGVDDPLDVSGNTPTPKPVIQDFEVQQPFVKAAGDPPKPNGKPTPPPLRKVPTKPEPAQVGVEAEEPPILEKIRTKLEENNKILITARTERTRWSATQAIAALSYLEQAYTQHNSSPLSILGGNNDLMPSGKSQASREQRRLNSGAPTGQDTAQRENLNQDSDETDLIE